MGNARAYYDSLPSKSGTAKLEKELAGIQSRIERTRRMVRLGTCPEDEGNTAILEDQQRVAQINAELRDAGSVMTLPPDHLVKAACERIAHSGAKLETFEERRPVLEKLSDLKFLYDNGVVEIEGKVPVAADAQKCKPRVAAYPKRQRSNSRRGRRQVS